MTTITVYTSQDWHMADSYGLIACQLARHLTRLGVRVNAMSLGKTVSDSQPDDIRAVTSRPILPALGGIVLGYPTNYQHQSALLHCGPRIAITMFESSRIPQDWIEPLNDMDAVIVPSWFCAEVFKACGVTAPIHVVPLGIGDSYQYAERSAGRPLTFLAFFDRGERKGGIMALQAFLRAFGEDANYKLIFKHRASRVPWTMTNPNIEVVLQDMSEQELYELYCQCDVLINPHKGEGFGMIPREFSSSGGLAMTTGWSGTADELERWGYALPYTLEPALWKGHKTLEGKDLGEWAKVDVDRLATQLQIVANAWPHYRSTLPAKAQAARELYSWQCFAQQVLSIWEGVTVGKSFGATKAAA